MIAHPRSDRFHCFPVPLLGGPACLLGLIAAVVGWSLLTGACSHPTGVTVRLFVAAGVGSLGLLVLGLLDDHRACSPFRKGLVQAFVLLGVFLFWRPEGRLATLPVGVAAWFCALVLINAWNYLDHADAVFASASVPASVLLVAGSGAALGGGCAAGALWGFCGSMLGFLVWNRPPARIFLGDAGSLPLAFLLVLASLVIIDSGPPEVLPVAVAVHCVPWIDMLLVTISRLRAGTSPLRGGRDHSAHRLTSVLGRSWTPVVFALAAAAFGLVGRFLGPINPVLAVAALVFTGSVLALGLLGLAPPARRPAEGPSGSGRPTGTDRPPV